MTPPTPAAIGAPALRVGCDVQSLLAVRESVERFGDRYLERILGAGERERASTFVATDALVRHLCGRFAAKEAVFKVLRGAPDAAVPWPQIEILADAVGAPLVRLSGVAAALAASAGIGEISVSLSHAESFAFAVAVAVPLMWGQSPA